MSWTVTGRVAALLTVVALGGTLVGCGGGSSAPSGPTAQQQITTTWTSFFTIPSAITPTAIAQKEALLQNGTALAPLFQQLAKLATGASLSSTVSNVALNGNTANVTFTIKFGSQTLGPETGLAVKVGGKWLVSAQTFCGLAELATGAKGTPAGCPAA